MRRRPGDDLIRDLTTGSIPRHLLALAGPVVTAMLMQSAYALIDLAWVGRLGQAAVAGLSISLQVFFVLLALSQVVATTTLATISQTYGAGRADRARGLFSAFLVTGAVLGLAATGAALAVADPYVAAFTDDPEVHAQGLAYFRVNALTFFTQLVLIVLGNGFRGSGDFITPMKALVTAVVINVVLDPVLIFGVGPIPAMGLAGAAWATVIAQSLALLGYSVHLSLPSSERALGWARPAWSRGLLRRLVVHGGPAGLQFILLSVVLGIILVAMKPLGAIWTATAGGGFRLLQQGLLPMIAVGSASAALCGQNLGAGHLERIRRAARTALSWTLAYGVLISAAFMLGGRFAGRVFASTPAGLDAAEVYFLWSGPGMVGFAMSIVPTFALQALSRPILPLIAAVFRIALLALAVFALLPGRTDAPEAVFAAATVATWLEGAIGYGLLEWHVGRLLRAAARGSR